MSSSAGDFCNCSPTLVDEKWKLNPRAFATDAHRLHRSGAPTHGSVGTLCQSSVTTIEAPGEAMQARETTLATLVQGQKQFQVPLYQRTYSWTDKELRPLWADILEQARVVSEGSGGTMHFLGSVVVAPSPQTSPSFPRWLVVDGQQRLTTLSLALLAIRDHLGDSKQRERIEDLYLVNKYRDGHERLRLLPTQADRRMYGEHVHNTQSGGSDRISGAYRFFRQELVKAADASDPYDIEHIELAITTRLTLVDITADKADNVHRIFESLNNTGLKLSQADLLRNYLFMRLPTRDEHVYSTYWLPLQRKLTNAQLEQLMWLHLVLEGDSQVRLQDIYAAQQGRLDVGDATEATVEAYVVELHRRSRQFLRILNPDAEPDARVRGHLQRIRDWQGVTTYPVLMVLLERHSAKELTNDQLVQALSYVESFLVRRALCRIPTNSLPRIFQAVPSQLPARVPASDGLRQVLSATSRYWPSDSELREAIRTKPIYLQSQKTQQRFVLRRLEESLAPNEPVDFEQAKLTIEHVLPQSPGEEWLALLAADAEAGESAEDVHRRLVHTLGNLTLTSQNSHLSNHPFERKQDLLRSSSLEMNKRIAGTDSWGATEILARADELAERAITLWPAPLPGVERVERGRDWDLLHQALAALPDGTWTTYGDLAALIGSHPVPVGRHLADVSGITNAYRALGATGRVAEGFRWAGDVDRGDVHDVLAADGIRFNAAGIADPGQRLTTHDLAELIGLPVAEDQAAGDARTSRESAVDGARRNRFRTQLTDHNETAVEASVMRLLDNWCAAGGVLDYGAGRTVTSCSLTLARPGAEDIWALVVYPMYGGQSGFVEVVFQHLSRRAPFDAPELRAELRTRINRLGGVDLPEGKLALRPSFPLAVLADPQNVETLTEALIWFHAAAAGNDVDL
ncbi:DUF262 domain-containing protein [Embleya sp. NPDC050493]|uniref:GmrSD restriction endonuclease domain-containing protein n=1 Tax=Embleya sp. NPDC050493 TaxID=3363989 RepID=UPI0037B4C5A3